MQPEALEVCEHPAARRTRSHAQLQLELPGALDEVVDAGQRRALLQQLQRARALPLPQRLAIYQLADLAFELFARVESIAARADTEQPAIERKVGAVLEIDLAPSLVLGRLGVEDQPVEIEDQGANGVASGWRRRGCADALAAADCSVFEDPAEKSPPTQMRTGPGRPSESRNSVRRTPPPPCEIRPDLHG